MPCYYEFMVERLDFRPITWQRFLFRANLTFEDLHQAIQAAAGWSDRHAYRFWSIEGDLITRKDHPSLEAWHAATGDRTPIGAYFCLDDSVKSDDPDRYPPPPPDICVYEYPPEIGFFKVTLQHRVLLDEVFERRLLGGGGIFSPEMEDVDGDNHTVSFEECTGKTVMHTSNRHSESDKSDPVPMWDLASFNLDMRKLAFDR